MQEKYGLSKQTRPVPSYFGTSISIGWWATKRNTTAVRLSPLLECAGGEQTLKLEAHWQHVVGVVCACVCVIGVRANSRPLLADRRSIRM